MGLKILKNADGTFRPTWYGRISVGGKKRETNLNVPIEGTPPVDESGKVRLTAKGDAAFEHSRKAAKKAFDAWRKETQTDPAALQKKAYKARTGVSLDGLPLSHLAAAWRGISRTYTPTQHKLKLYDATFARFETFARKYCEEWNAAHPNKRQCRCETLNDITPELATAWFNDIRATYSWETVKNQMSLLSGAYSRFSTSGMANPFKGIIKRNRETATRRVKRQPLTQEQIERIFKLSRDDEFFHPLIVCAACTGMRIGDICRLKWADVDMRGKMIDCVTAKAGVRVTIPIFPALRKVLKACAAVPGDGATLSPFVFPEAARRYDYKTDKGVYSLQGHILNGVKPYIGMAIDDGKTDAEPAATIADETGTPDPEKAIAAINAAPFTVAKTERLIAVFKLYTDGKSYSTIAEEVKTSKGQVSADLREIERVTGLRLRPGKTKNRFTHGGKTIDELIQATRRERKNADGVRVGKRAACLYGWHSFRTAFVVMAVDAGVPVAKVQEIVGHADTKMTLDYYRPTKAHEAERVVAQMAGTVLGTGDVVPMIEGAAIEAPGNKAPVQLPAPSKSVADRLRELKALADEGLITKSEYATQRKTIIESI